MDLDIALKLMPNILTMLAQLGATFVIYRMYRKFLHEPVQAYLDKRADLLESEVSDAKKLREDASVLKVQMEEETKHAQERIQKVEEEMLAEAKVKRQAIIDGAQDVIRDQKDKLEKDYNQEKQKLYQDVSQYMLDVAVEVNRKVLSNHDFDSSTMIEALEKEMNDHDLKH